MLKCSPRSVNRRGLVREEIRFKTNKFKVDDVNFRTRLKERVDELCNAADSHAEASAFGSLLQQCANARALVEGKRLHARALELGLLQDRLVSNFLVFMYGKCKRLETAREVFESMPRRNEFSYSIMLQAFADNGRMLEAQKLLNKMPLQADISRTTMITGYARNGDVIMAEKVFEELPEKHVVAWTAMVTAFAQTGHPRKSFQMFGLMDLDGFCPDSVAFISVLDACSTLGALKEGRLIYESAVMCGLGSESKVANTLLNLFGRCGCLHEARALFQQMPVRTIVTWTTMVGMYAQNGLPEEAQAIFNEMPYRNVVAWNALLTAYNENGCGKKALQVFRMMDLDGVEPDAFTYLSVLDACSAIPHLLYGRLLHSEINQSSSAQDPKVGNALVDLYSKCGQLGDAVKIFNQLPVRIRAAWNSMIGAYSQAGHGKDALGVFELMGLEGVFPDEISFINVISGCGHSGLFKDGLRLFVSLTPDYGIQRVYDHFVCAVNVLCQAGLLDQAEELIDNLPFFSDEIPYIALLTACKLHNDVPRAARAAEQVRRLNPRTSAPYLMLGELCKVEENEGVLQEFNEGRS